MNSSTTPTPDKGQQDTLNLIEIIKNLLEMHKDWESGKREEADQSLADIKACVLQNSTPAKAQLDNLIKAVGGHEELTSPALQLVERFGYIPSL